MSELKCGYSDVQCTRCIKNPMCPIYSERYVLTDQLRKLNKSLEDALTLTKAVLRR